MATMDESAKENVWVLLSDLFVDTVHTERELRAIGAALKGTGLSADDVERILRKEVAPVCGRWMRYPTIGPWPMFDPEDLKQRIRAHLNRPWYKPPLIRNGLFGLSDVKRSWEIVRDAMESGDRIPALSGAAGVGYRLSGSPPEFAGETLRAGPDFLHGCRIVDRWELADPTAVIRVLTDPENYGDRGRGARCFFPGFAFSFGRGQESTDVLVCLECNWVVFHGAGGRIALVPSEGGSARLRELYVGLFEKPNDAI